MTTTRIWDELKRVPENQLKGFARAGGFKGTAIKPMWTIHRMTEVFGPCGTGWGMDEPVFTVTQAGAETLVFCTVAVWFKDHEARSAPVYGVGGDKVLTFRSSGPFIDDEAFKKAYTDALTNALKHIGAGADVHMGLWDGNKYVDDAEPAKPSAKAPSRDGYTRLEQSMRANRTADDLIRWWNDPECIAERDKLPPDWKVNLQTDYRTLGTQLRAKETKADNSAVQNMMAGE